MKVRLDSRVLACVFAGFVLLSGSSVSRGELRIGSVCRVKGQEENVLHGIGLIVGLKGTGDADLALRGLAQSMLQMGYGLTKNAKGEIQTTELKNAKNVALVHVSATVSGKGEREGSKIECRVKAFGAKSLEGGELMTTALVGPNPSDKTVYAIAAGDVEIDAAAFPTSGRIHQGCRLEQNFRHEFTSEGRIMLVIQNKFAGFEVANEIETLINEHQDFRDSLSGQGRGIAKAIDSKTIEVQIPDKYADSLVDFVAAIQSIPILSLPTTARVTINERNGVVVVGQDVDVRPVVITHKNMTISTGAASRFIPVDPGSDTSVTKLKALVDALNAIKVPTEDVIDVIKELDRNGALYGELDVQ